MASGPRTVVHLAPHPDDEALGAPALLLALRAGGCRVVNVVCSLGRTGQHRRRAAEVTEACRRAGFELAILDPPLALSSRGDPGLAQASLVTRIGELVAELVPDVVLAPSPHDRHPGHEVVGRAARDALASPDMPVLWLWGLWGELPLPTLCFGFGEEELDAAGHVLSAHVEEVARNDYIALLRARAVASRVLGAERVFGFGAPGLSAPYAELLTEVRFAAGEWWAGRARELAPGARPRQDGRQLGDTLEPIGRDRPLGWWMNAPSFTTLLERRAGSLDSP